MSLMQINSHLFADAQQQLIEDSLLGSDEIVTLVFVSD